MPQTAFGSRRATLTSNRADELPGTQSSPWRQFAGANAWRSRPRGKTLPAAAPVTWNGATSSNWFDPGNWTPGTVPDATNVANINTLSPNPTVISGAGANGLTDFVGRNAGDVGSLEIINGGTLSDSQGPVGRFAGAIGTVTVDGAGSAWLHSDDFYVGGEGTGTVSILNGGLQLEQDLDETLRCLQRLHGWAVGRLRCRHQADVRRTRLQGRDQQ